jgi:hypothetical protein
MNPIAPPRTLESRLTFGTTRTEFIERLHLRWDSLRQKCPSLSCQCFGMDGQAPELLEY